MREGARAVPAVVDPVRNCGFFLIEYPGVGPLSCITGKRHALPGITGVHLQKTVIFFCVLQVEPVRLPLGRSLIRKEQPVSLEPFIKPTEQYAASQAGTMYGLDHQGIDRALGDFIMASVMPPQP